MKKLRAANFTQAIGRPFNLLRGLDFIDYQENKSVENARMLHEALVDVALIPASEYAMHGDYVGLDFGIACIGESRRLILYSREELYRVHTIYVYENCVTSAMLLKLLLDEYWKIGPKIVRRKHEMTPDELKDNEALLMLQDPTNFKDYPDFMLQEDLIKVWHNWTGLPFVFAFWAARPGSLSVEQARALNEVFHICLKAKNIAIAEHAEKDLPYQYLSEAGNDPYFFLHMDESMLEGLRYFYKLCAQKNLMPITEYRSASFAIGSQNKMAAAERFSIDRILDDTLNGERLSIAHGLRLANEASLSDLGMAADLMRQRLYSERSAYLLMAVNETELDELSVLCQRIKHRAQEGVSQIILYPETAQYQRSLAFYEHALSTIRNNCDVWIEGFGPTQLLALAKKEKISFHDLVARLVAAGLDIVPSWGGEYLIDDDMRERKLKHDSGDWIRAVQWVQRFGAKACCSLDISRVRSWDEVLMHLYRLRSLQDLTAGFWQFCVWPAFNNKVKGIPGAELHLRSVALARLFLDNIAGVYEVRMSDSDTIGTLGLWFGANAAHIMIDGEAAVDIEKVRATFKGLSARGMDFRADTLGDSPISFH